MPSEKPIPPSHLLRTDWTTFQKALAAQDCSPQQIVEKGAQYGRWLGMTEFGLALLHVAAQAAELQKTSVKETVPQWLLILLLFVTSQFVDKNFDAVVKSFPRFAKQSQVLRNALVGISGVAAGVQSEQLQPHLPLDIQEYLMALTIVMPSIFAVLYVIDIAIPKTFADAWHIDNDSR